MIRRCAILAAVFSFTTIAAAANFKYVTTVENTGEKVLIDEDSVHIANYSDKKEELYTAGVVIFESDADNQLLFIIDSFECLQKQRGKLRIKQKDSNDETELLWRKGGDKVYDDVANYLCDYTEFDFQKFQKEENVK